ncbi:biotin carboxylase [Ktedonobacteria bacterium brp13]|nr:biotin carboxylase [Ktedonobacteria bacterium brp13]
MSERKISPRHSSAILQAFSNGVTPRIGLEHVVVGRSAEIEALLDDLDYRTTQGGASFRMVVGPYGSGKSFMLQVIRNYALQRDFVVADADLSAERRLTGTKGQGLSLYRELLKNMAIRTRPEGGAFAPLLERWMNDVQHKVMQETNIAPDAPYFPLLVEQKVQETLRSISALTNSFDFARVLSLYWRAYQVGDEGKMEQAIRWLRGEYQVLAEVRADLEVRSMITDGNWYNYLKLFAAFFQQIGYKGLVIFFDEAVNLYKISNATSRNNNYEQFLTLFNDINQGVAQYLGMIFSGTPQLVEDPKRGLYSYEALRSRLQESQFTQQGRRSFAGPIIRLDTLTNEELFVLLQRLRNIHAQHYRYTTTITDNDLQQFMAVITAQIGASKQLTPREIARDLIAVMEMMRRDSAATFSDIIHKREFAVSLQQSNPDELTPQNEIFDDDDSSFAGFTL